jgi:hypothetical protein
MPTKKATKRVAMKPASAEMNCIVDVSVRLEMFGKPEKIRDETRRRLDLELDLKFPKHEIRRLVVTAKP